MKTVIITGGTRGIGYGLADAFLQRGCQVAISGRSQDSVDKAIKPLAAKYSADRVLGQPCEVTDPEQVQALWDAAKTRFGTVDIWINNAGISQDLKLFIELPSAAIKQIVDINVSGMMIGSQVALRGMVAQGSGQVYNMEGLGSDGAIQAMLGVYGTTKYALRYFTKYLVKEMKDRPVQVGTLSPGMVVTDLLLSSYAGDPQGLERAKKIFNILADRVETVVPFLADGVLANGKTGAHIEWLTRAKIFQRFLTAPFHKRDVFTPSV